MGLQNIDVNINFKNIPLHKLVALCDSLNNLQEEYGEYITNIKTDNLIFEKYCFPKDKFIQIDPIEILKKGVLLLEL